ncbi:UNKNOWN [Stylonychia lemnae]|uniref:N-acetyltransferase domain-containing protein n=1 Tax=Stylonychia lemnae TaxID=5949 RepID=A0A078B0I7_STYLE|nr:UNKNOWN [Stylonychia lemnae]|eukprot:CDW88170.1 UNKNOWN [Stylonychia lemnae]
MQQNDTQSLRVKKIESDKELDEAMKMRTKVIQKNKIFNKYTFDEIYSEEEQRATKNIISEGFGCCALNEQGEIVSVILAFDLTFEPYKNPEQLTPPQQAIYKIRNQALAILKPQKKMQAAWVGYAATNEDYRRQGIQGQMILAACQEGFRKGIEFSVVHIISLESYNLAKAVGMKMFGYSESSDPSDERVYFTGEGNFSKDMGINALAIIDMSKLQDSDSKSKL